LFHQGTQASLNLSIDTLNEVLLKSLVTIPDYCMLVYLSMPEDAEVLKQEIPVVFLLKHQ
jgi:hypothetical protein